MGGFTPERQIIWDGDGAFHHQTNQRYLTVVNAVRNRWCAVMDNHRDELDPIRVA